MNGYLCPEGTIAIPVRSEEWVEAVMDTFPVGITASGTVFLIVLKVMELSDFVHDPTPEQLTYLLR